MPTTVEISEQFQQEVRSLQATLAKPPQDATNKNINSLLRNTASLFEPICQLSPETLNALLNTKGWVNLAKTLIKKVSPITLVTTSPSIWNAIAACNTLWDCQVTADNLLPLVKLTYLFFSITNNQTRSKNTFSHILTKNKNAREVIMDLVHTLCESINNYLNNQKDSSNNIAKIEKTLTSIKQSSAENQAYKTCYKNLQKKMHALYQICSQESPDSTLCQFLNPKHSANDSLTELSKLAADKEQARQALSEEIKTAGKIVLHKKPRLIFLNGRMTLDTGEALSELIKNIKSNLDFITQSANDKIMEHAIRAAIEQEIEKYTQPIRLKQQIRELVEKSIPGIESTLPLAVYIDGLLKNDKRYLQLESPNTQTTRKNNMNIEEKHTEQTSKEEQLKKNQILYQLTKVKLDEPQFLNEFLTTQCLSLTLLPETLSIFKTIGFKISDSQISEYRTNPNKLEQILTELDQSVETFKQNLNAEITNKNQRLEGLLQSKKTHDTHHNLLCQLKRMVSNRFGENNFKDELSNFLKNNKLMLNKLFSPEIIKRLDDTCPNPSKRDLYTTITSYFNPPPNPFEKEEFLSIITKKSGEIKPLKKSVNESIIKIKAAIQQNTQVQYSIDKESIKQAVSEALKKARTDLIKKFEINTLKEELSKNEENLINPTKDKDSLADHIKFMENYIEIDEKLTETLAALSKVSHEVFAKAFCAGEVDAYDLYKQIKIYPTVFSKIKVLENKLIHLSNQRKQIDIPTPLQRDFIAEAQACLQLLESKLKQLNQLNLEKEAQRNDYFTNNPTIKAALDLLHNRGDYNKFTQTYPINEDTGPSEFKRPKRNYAKHDYRNICLAGIQLTGIDFSTLQIEGMNLSGSHLINCTLPANCRGINLENATLKNCEPTGALIRDYRGIRLNEHTTLDWGKFGKDILLSNLTDLNQKEDYLTQLCKTLATKDKTLITGDLLCTLINKIGEISNHPSASANQLLILKKQRARLVVNLLLPHCDNLTSLVELHKLCLMPNHFLRKERHFFRTNYGNTNSWNEIINSLKNRLTILNKSQPLTNEPLTYFNKIQNTSSQRSHFWGLFRCCQTPSDTQNADSSSLENQAPPL